MKTTAAGLGAAFVLLGSASATTTFFYAGGVDNTGDYGLTPDASAEAIGWADNAVVNDGTTNQASTSTIQANLPILTGTGQGVALFSFGSLGGLTGAEVNSATLHTSFQGSNGSVTWQIVGLAPGNAIDDAGSSFTLQSAGAAWIDGGGSDVADINGAAITNYGSFSTTTGMTGISFDVTAALVDQLNGAISGIAIVNATPSTSFATLDNVINFHASEAASSANRPGIFVDATAVPEPSTTLLGGVFGLLLLARRRRA